MAADKALIIFGLALPVVIILLDRIDLRRGGDGSTSGVLDQDGTAVVGGVGRPPRRAGGDPRGPPKHSLATLQPRRAQQCARRGLGDPEGLRRRSWPPGRRRVDVVVDPVVAGPRHGPGVPPVRRRPGGGHRGRRAPRRHRSRARPPRRGVRSRPSPRGSIRSSSASPAGTLRGSGQLLLHGTVEPRALRVHQHLRGEHAAGQRPRAGPDPPASSSPRTGPDRSWRGSAPPSSRSRWCSRRLILAIGGLAFGVDWGDPVAAFLLVVAVRHAVDRHRPDHRSSVRNADQAQSIGIPFAVGDGHARRLHVAAQHRAGADADHRSCRPHAWAMDAWQKLIFDHGGLADIAPQLAVLAGAAVGAVGGRRAASPPQRRRLIRLAWVGGSRPDSGHGPHPRHREDRRQRARPPAGRPATRSTSSST